MPLTNDIELNGVAFTVVPGAYKKGLRKAQSVSRPPARRTGKAIFGPFERGVLQAAAEDDERGWFSLNVGPVFDGGGVEPFPNSTTHADAMSDTPSTTTRAYGCVAGAAAYVGIGRRIYKSVALTNGTWASFTLAADLGAGFTISGLTYFQDDILISLSSGQDIRKLNTVTNAVSIWRAGEKAQKGVAYAGQFIYAPLAANNQEELRLSGTKWNGNAVTHFRYLDAPIINMASFNGQVVIATRKSLYFMGGQPYPGEQDDAAITGDSSRAPEWRGDPEPVMGHGSFAEGDDFVFLESYRGRLYTWLGGRVAEFDSSTEEANWLRMGPEGVRCYGAAVAGDWLIVAVESRYGQFEAWGFDGQGWWLLLQRATTPAVVWPMALAGAGNRDALLFRDGSTTYDLLRLRWRSSTLHTYATSGEWVSSLIDGDDPTADKAWRRIGATFAAPGDRGNTASVDSVSFPLEYSIDGGLTWVTVEDTAAASGAGRVLTRGVDYGSAAPTSRYLQLRQRWSSVSDWAPVLTSLWVEYEDADAYALAELAQAEYEAGIAAEDLLRRRWEITVDAGDGRVTRAGARDAKTGRQAIAALWDAWELGTTVTFKDIDHDSDPTTYLVNIVGMEEKGAQPADSARWGQSTVTVVLEETSPGAVLGTVSSLGLDDLDDVTLGALLDGDFLVYDSATGQWVNEAVAGLHDPVTVVDTATVDLTLVGQQLSAVVIQSGLSLQNLGGAVTDAQVPNSISLDNITQIATRPHGSLTGIGSNDHAAIDTHIAAANPHSGSQPLDAELTALAGLASAADRVPYFTGAATAALATLTAFGRSLIAAADVAAAKTLLALTKSDLGLGNVDNTSDATKNAAVATLTNKTLTAPVIADFTNMAHDHLDADDGGTLSAAAITSGQFPIARLAGGTPDGTKFIRDDGTLAVPAGSGGGTPLTVAEGGVVVDATVSTLDFDASDFTLTESPEDEITIGLAYGTSAGTPAEGNHAHAGVYQPLDSDLTTIAGLADPNADRILFWDDSAGAYAYLTPGTNLSITGTTIDAAGGSSTPTLYVLFMTRPGSAGSADFTWSNMPATATELFGVDRQRRLVDLTSVTEYLFSVELLTSGAAGAFLDLEYATNLSSPSWTSMGGSTLSLAATGFVNGGWDAVPVGARTTVLLRVIGDDGNGTADPVFQSIAAQFR